MLTLHHFICHFTLIKMLQIQHTNTFSLHHKGIFPLFQIQFIHWKSWKTVFKTAPIPQHQTKIKRLLLAVLNDVWCSREPSTFITESTRASLNISLACVYVVLSAGLRSSLRRCSIGFFHLSFCFDLGRLSLLSLTIENLFLCAFQFHYSLPREDDWHTQILFHLLKYCN